MGKREDEMLRKVMSTLGRKGGRVGGRKGFAAMDPARAAEIQQKAHEKLAEYHAARKRAKQEQEKAE